MKKASKRFLAILLALILTLGILPVGSFAAPSGLTLRVDKTSGSQGSEVNVKLSLEGNTGISSVGVVLTYDTSILTLKDMEFNTAEMGGSAVKPPLKSPCNLNWVNGTENFEGESVTFATLTFQISEDAPDNSVAELKISYDPSNIYKIIDGGFEDVPLTVVNGSVTVYPCKPGDINGDNTVNNKDASLLMQYLAGWDVAVNEQALDTNGDSSVNNKDVSLLMQYLAGWDVSLQCGGVVIERCDHTMDAIPFKAATCTQDGNIAYWHCTKCDKYFDSELGIKEIKLADTVIPKTHALQSVPEKAPTTSAPGNIAYWKCTACGKYFRDATGTLEVSPEEVEIPMIETGKTAVIYDLEYGYDYLKYVDIKNHEDNADVFVSSEGMNLQQPYNPPGFTFDHWELTDGTPVSRLEPQKPGTTITVRAVWNRVNYRIDYVNYKSPVGDVIDEKFLTYTIDEGQPNFPNTECNNYVFLGWYDENGNEVTSIPAGTTGNIVLNAYWTSLRNMARAMPLEDPIILDDIENGAFYFLYELGTIENIPLSDAIWSIQSVAGLEQQVEKEVSVVTSSVQAQSISNTISNSTVDSSTWTLSEEWNDTIQINEKWAEERGLTVEEAQERATTSSGTFSITDENGGSDSQSTTDGTTTLTYDSQEKTDEKGSQFDVEVNGKYSASASVSTSVSGSVSYPGVTVGGEVGTNLETGFEIGGSVGYGNYHKDTTKTHSGTDTTKVDTTVVNTASSWNSSKTASQTQTASQRETVTQAISEIISSEKGYGKTYVRGGSSSDSQGFSSTDSTSINSSSTVTYSTEKHETTTTTYKSDGMLEGKYRLVLAGTAHVFGVVGYDVASRSYFTYTFSVMDDETHEFLDYTPKNANFDDYENGVLPFEIPYEVYEYVAGYTAMTEGLLYRTNSVTGTATIVGYTGSSTDVTVPAYISSGNTMYKVTEINAAAFAGKTNVRAVMLSRFIDEIPAGAFKNCTALEEVSGYFTKIGNEAFSGCTSLDKFNVSESVSYIGENAFANAKKISVKALGGEAALALAKKLNPSAEDETLLREAAVLTTELVGQVIKAGAREVVLDLSAIQDGVALTLDIPENMDCFELLGGMKTYSDMRIISHAAETVIRKATIENYNAIPLEIYSDNLTLEVVTVNSTNFAMTLGSEHPNISLFRDSHLKSARGNALVCKMPTFIGEIMESTVGLLDVSGNVYVCGDIAGRENLFVTNGEILTLSEDNFAKFINGGFQVNLNAMGGSISQTSVNAAFGEPYGEIPAPTKNHYAFSGWYTEAEGGDLITADTLFEELSDITLYAHWTLNSFNIALNANGGNVSQTSLNVIYGEPIGSLPTPTRDYYTFDGWYTAASGGTCYTENTVFNSNGDIILYAHWTLKPVSSWVLASNIPSGAQITNQKWTYNQRTNTESQASALPGYTQYDSYWVQSGSGSFNYSREFPSGFDTSNYYYQNWNRDAVTAYENATNKRTVSTGWGGYIYWHWMYDTNYARGTSTRAIYNRYGTGPDNGFLYKYFGAFDSTTNYTGGDYGYCNSQNIRNYIVPDRTSWDSCQGATRWFRFNYYTCSYTDYYKMFKYYKIESKESSTEITAGGLISDVQHWVQYREK